MVRHRDVVLDVLEAAGRDVGDRVLLPVDRALLEGEEQLLVGHLGRVGAQRLGVHQELRGVGEPHPQAVEVAGLADRLVGGELTHAGRPRAQGVHAGLVLESLQQLAGGVAVEVAREVVAVVEGVRRVEHGHRLVDRAQCGCALDVHVDVAGDDRGDPVGVRSELARGEDLDRHPDVGLLDLVCDDLRAAAVLRLVLGVAVGQLQSDVARRTPRPRRLSSSPPQAARNIGSATTQAARAALLPFVRGAIIDSFSQWCSESGSSRSRRARRSRAASRRGRRAGR